MGQLYNNICTNDIPCLRNFSKSDLPVYDRYTDQDDETIGNNSDFMCDNIYNSCFNTLDSADFSYQNAHLHVCINSVQSSNIEP